MEDFIPQPRTIGKQKKVASYYTKKVAKLGQNVASSFSCALVAPTLYAENSNVEVVHTNGVETYDVIL